MTFHPPQSRISAADPASGVGINRGIGEKLLAILAGSAEPLSTIEIAGRAKIWPYEASSILAHMRKAGKVKVAGKIKGPGFGISRRMMNLWVVA